MSKKFVLKRPQSTQETPSIGPLIFERLMWVLLMIVVVVAFSSYLLRQEPVENADEQRSVKNKIVRQIPRAQLDQAEQIQFPPSTGAQPIVLPPSLSGKEKGVDSMSGETDAASGSGMNIAPASNSQVDEKKKTNREQHMPPMDSSANHPQYVVRVGAFKNKKSVDEICARIEKNGFTTQVREYQHKRLGHLYIVELAPFDDKMKAEKAKELVEKQEKLKALLIPVE